jgi:hypothetical protein
MLVRRRDRPAADAGYGRGLPVPGLPAEDGGGANFEQPCILKALSPGADIASLPVDGRSM